MAVDMSTIASQQSHARNTLAGLLKITIHSVLQIGFSNLSYRKHYPILVVEYALAEFCPMDGFIATRDMSNPVPQERG